MPSRQHALAAVGASCGILSIAAWLFYLRAFLGLHGDDWMVFYTAARTVIEGRIAILYDGDRLTTILNAHFAHWLSHPLPLHPFLYPPHYLLVIVPFGFLPPLGGGILFLVVTYCALVGALWSFARTREERWIFTLAILLSPAAAITVCAGQNAFLTCALLVAGFGLSPKRPVLGGIVLSLLSVKPQLALMVPIALVASRQWKTLAAAGVAAMGLVAVSVVLFGPEPWRAWFTIMTSPSELYLRWNSETRLNGLSIYCYATFLGAPDAIANVLQVVAALGAGALVYWSHRRAMPAELRLAILLTATMLASPHVLLYDAMTIEVAASLFFVYALRHGAPLPDVIVSAAVWLVMMINPPTLFAVGLVTPVLMVLLLALAVRRGLESGDRYDTSAPGALVGAA